MNKNISTKICIGILLIISNAFSNKLFSQTQGAGIFFQAVARDNFSNPAKDRKIYIQSTIIQNTENGTKVLIEEHQSQTDPTGVFSISIGQGTRKGGTAANLGSIEWVKGPYYLNLKIAIQPIAPVINWDYSKELIDLGTTPFGTVPYALYSATSGALDSKLSIADTTKMLAIYAKAQTVQSLSAAVSTKISTTDTSAMLAPYAKMVNAIVASNITSLTAATINAALDSKVSVADSGTVYATPTQLKGVKFDTTSLIARVDKKISIADSITKYVTPTQLASKTFDSTAIYRQLALRLNKADTSFLLQKADTATLSNRINLKATTTDVNTSLALKFNKADTSFLLQKADTATLSNRINLKANNTDVTNGLALKLDASQRGVANGVASLDANSKVPAAQIPVISFASASVVANEAAMLALSGAIVGSIAIRTDVSKNFVLSAAGPSVLSNWVELATPTSVTSINGLAGPTVSLTTNEITEGTTNKYFTDTRARNAISVSAPLNYNAATGTLTMTAATASSNGYLRSADFTTFNNKQNTLVAGTDYATPSGNITGNAANVTGVVSIINGGTGTSTATGALTNLGAEPTANKSTATDLGSTSPSDILFPSQKAVKTYVDLQNANAGVADLSITNAKLAGSISADKLAGSIPNNKLSNSSLTIGTTNIALGATTTSLAGLSSVGSTGFTGALTGNVTGNVTGDLTGNASTATKLAATKNINGVAFDGSANITITADANTLTGTTLASNVLSSSLTSVGTITTGVWSGTEIAIAKGGTGATTAAGARTNLGLGALATKSIIADADVDASAAIAFSKLNITKANITGLGVQEGLTAGSGISINAGTISATGLTTSNLASNANITNAQLANSTTTLGSTTMTLGGTITSVTGLSSVSSTGFTGALTGNASTATTLATGRTIALTGDVTYTSPSFDGSGNVTGAATLTNTSVTAGDYGSSTAIPTFTVDSKGRLTAASTVGITAGVNSLNYTTTTSYAAGGTISGTSLTLTAADASNAGLISTGAQTIAGAKTFNSNIIGNLSGNATSATTAGNITATTNTTLTSLTNLNTVGTITTGTWSASTIDIAHGGTGLTSVGSNGQVLSSNGTSIAWTNPAATGITSINGITSGTQTLTVGTAGTAPAFSSASSTHTLNIPLASATSVTAGLLSKSDYDVFNAKQTALTAGSGISISGGTISATGLTTSNLSSTAGITNAQLANSTTTLGSTTMTLGGTVTSVTGLTSVSSTGFTGALTGNASSATALATGRTISTTGDITFTSGSFDGTTNVTGTATLTNTAVTVGSYGSSTAIPTFTVDAKGRLTAAGTTSIVADAGTLSGTITAAGKVANSATTATNANTANAIVARDASGNFTAGTITGTLSGTATNISGVVAIANGGTGLTSVGTSGQVLSSNGTSIAWTNPAATGITSINGITSGTQTLTVGNTGTAPAFSSASSTHTLNIPMASESSVTAGLLSKTQYDVLNAKQTALTAGAGSGISISGGTISATGLTTSNLSSSAGITNAQLAGSIAANKLVGTDIATVGTITSGTWNGSTLAVEYGGTGATTIAAARTNLGLGSAAYSNTSNFEVPLTFSSPLSRTTNTISIPAATSSVNGYLTSTDWLTFNNKQTALTAGAGSGISISGGTISATGLTTSNLSSSAGITVDQLATKTTTLGSTTMTLGGTVTAVTGLTSVTSTNFIGTLSGTATNVSGIVAIANGGTGSSTQNFVDLSTTQTIAGAKTLSGITTISNSSNSTSTTTGALIVNGGAGIAGAVYAGSLQNTPVGSTTASTGSFTTLAASGTSTLTTLTTTGAATLASTSITGAASVGSTLGVIGATTLSGTSAHGGAATFSSTVNVTGATTLTSLTAGTSTLTSLSVTNNETVGGTLGVTGATSLTSLTASGTSTLTTLTTTGAATFSSTVKISTGAAAGKVLTSDASGNATWQNTGGTVVTMSATGTATSTATYIIFTGSTASQTITIPSAVTLGAGREITIKNVASVSVSIASAGGYLIQDNSTLTSTGAALGIEPSNNWMKLVSDGTNWYIFRALF